MNAKKKLSCLIIEDEPLAAELLEDYVNQVSFLDLKGICKDALFALERLETEAIDVIFLDIHLPKLKGLEFLRSLKQKPQTILTTAYHQYALEAFEEEVVDYLMKPIAFPRFLKAVNKLKRESRDSTSSSPPSELAQSSRPFHFFAVNKKKVKVFFDEILYVESLKDYARICTAEQEVITRMPISELEEMLQAHGLLRIHRSFIVAVDKIRAYSATEVEVGGKTLPIGRSYKELVGQRMAGL